MIFCTKCGKQFDEIAGFCPACGAPAHQQASQQAQQQQQQQQQQQYQQPQQQAQYQQPQYQQPQYQQPQYQQAPYQQPARRSSGLTIAAKILMIVGTILGAFCYLIPLAWCIPLTVIYFDKVKKGKPISTGFKVCCLIFVSTLGGIFMLCDKEN